MPMAFGVILAFGVAVLKGAVMQCAFGFGYALVVVPTMVLLYPEAVPVTPLLLALLMTSYMAIRERLSRRRSLLFEHQQACTGGDLWPRASYHTGTVSLGNVGSPHHSNCYSKLLQPKLRTE